MYTYTMTHRGRGIDFFLRTLIMIISQTIWKQMVGCFFFLPEKKTLFAAYVERNLLICLNTNANFSCT